MSTFVFAGPEAKPNVFMIREGMIVQNSSFRDQDRPGGWRNSAVLVVSKAEKFSLLQINRFSLDIKSKSDSPQHHAAYRPRQAIVLRHFPLAQL